MQDRPTVFADHHTHPYEKARSLAGMRRFVMAGLKQGVDILGLSDHGPMPSHLATHGMAEAELEVYVKHVQQLQAEFSEIDIKLGLEMDYHPDGVDYVQEITGRYPLDYVIGSVHIHTPGYAAMIAGSSLEDICESAFRLNVEAVETGLFDSLAHLDLCRWLGDAKRFGAFPGRYVPEQHKAGILQVLQALEKHDVCLEVNASGRDKFFGSILPDPEILAWADAYNLHYTFGSDAHQPERVGRGYDAVLKTMTPAQRSRLATFTNRQRQGLSARA